MYGTWVNIEGWEYMLEKRGASLYVTHIASPEDGGYGRTVKEKFPLDYFKTHTVEDLYRQISTLHISPTGAACYRDAELAKIKAVLKDMDII